jgi:hypothetical protein
MPSSAKTCRKCKISKGACYKGKVEATGSPTTRKSTPKDDQMAAKIQDLEKLVKKLQNENGGDGGNKDKDNAKEPAEASEEELARVEAARKGYEALLNTSPLVKPHIEGYDGKLAEAKNEWQEAQNRIAEGKPMDKRLKNSEAKLKRSQKVMEQKTETRTQAQQQLKDAQDRYDAACSAEADAQATLDSHKQELATLRRQSAEQVDGKPAHPEQQQTGGLSKEHSAMLATILNAIPQETLATICSQSGVDREEFVKTTNAALGATGATRPSERMPAELGGSSSKAGAVQETQAGGDFEEVEDELMCADYSVTEENFDSRIIAFVEAGFEEKENEERAAKQARLQIWANTKREEHREHTRAIKTQQKALGVARKVQKGKR